MQQEDIGVFERLEQLEKLVAVFIEEVRNDLASISAQLEGAGEWLDGIDDVLVEVASRVGVTYTGQGNDYDTEEEEELTAAPPTLAEVMSDDSDDDEFEIDEGEESDE